MKKMLLAAFAVMSLGMGTAFAVGGYTTTDPQYGTHAFPNQQYHTGTVFSEIYHGIFGYRSCDQASVARTADSRETANASRK
ncbi:MAG TPA: hypothetical protein DDZ81_16395 [Acetobacteraceae bacterium]|nr:hypothetical protein [Acetobacteraceae bacterium]